MRGWQLRRHSHSRVARSKYTSDKARRDVRVAARTLVPREFNELVKKRDVETRMKGHEGTMW